ncbi:natural killer cells antigen CD94-like [Orycteropus afer afer]|uniref:Natural killer cells antigen CD94-like n=1 Tax=Orycteropus afer afer TaxID=1230840 RepID=A0AC54Z989_ORYAF|nr:natural killer cells antigen CD94-like [Orycteropus afer afer]
MGLKCGTKLKMIKQTWHTDLKGTEFILLKDSENFLFCDIRIILEAVFQTAPWRLISGILGAVCLLLMVVLGILLNNLFSKQSIQPTSSPRPTVVLQEVSDCCSCPEKWIRYQCNCYFIFNKGKTWAESRNSCVSLNSSLLHLESRDEMGFWKQSQYYYWIGLSYNKKHSVWLWEDGSAPSQDLLSSHQSLKPNHCIVYSPGEVIFGEHCENENPYICKHRLI